MHESARLFRVICSHAWYSRDCGERKTTDFYSVPCRTYLPRTARATDSCTPRWFGRRTARVLLADFWYFWSCKSTIRENLLYDSSLSEFFSLVRKERKGQKEECFPLLNTFCRLAATGANTLPRPSNHSLAAATGSKRSSADSDLLLCHVGLWRTSRFKLWVRVCVRT